jgi:23S rRNA (guanosine2251-2'-O)-methyltransferase
MKKTPRPPHGPSRPRDPNNPAEQRCRPFNPGTRIDKPRGLDSPQFTHYGDRKRHPRQAGNSPAPVGRAFYASNTASVARRSDDRRERWSNGPVGRDLIFGVEPVRELLGAAPGAIRVLYVKAGAQQRFAAEIDAARIQGATVIPTEDQALVRIAGSEARHQGLIAIMREYQYAPFEEVIAEEHDSLLLIDGVTDPRNLGAIMRSAECAGVRAIVIARERTVGITPITVKSSAGAWAHLRIARCGNVAQALAALKQAGYWVVALAPAGELSIYDLDTSRRLAFVLGSEGRGVREIVKKSADFIASIPMRGRVASLNVSVAAAVALFEVARRRMGRLSSGASM